MNPGGHRLSNREQLHGAAVVVVVVGALVVVVGGALVVVVGVGPLVVVVVVGPLVVVVVVVVVAGSGHSRMARGIIRLSDQ